jgi:hypothetical protein
LASISARSENLWTSERVGNALLLVASKHAAGPMISTLELIGLVPPIRGEATEQESARSIREQVMRGILEAVVTSAFETAACLAPAHFARFAPELAPSVERTFSFSRGES